MCYMVYLDGRYRRELDVLQSRAVTKIVRNKDKRRDKAMKYAKHGSQDRKFTLIGVSLEMFQFGGWGVVGVQIGNMANGNCDMKVLYR